MRMSARGTVRMMSRNSGPEETQRSVAELLARYGGDHASSGVPSGGRRRRREADGNGKSEPDTTPQRIIDRIRSTEHGDLPPQRHSAHRHGAADLLDDEPEPGRHAVPTERLPGVEQSLFDAADTPAALPSPVPRRDVPAPPVTGQPPAGLDDGDWDGSPSAGAGVTVANPPLVAQPGAAQVPDSYGADGDHPAGEEASTTREWLVMATQLSAGVIGGAALWLAFQWMWRSMPVLALAVALVVITGLVWVVRVLRKAEDLQTTVVAVLVGLFVTVSPAALLLVAQ